MLLDRNGTHVDVWTRDAAATEHARLLPWDLFTPALPNDPAGTPVGIELPNTFEPDVLRPHFDQLALIAIGFPAFSDGRGFTLAKKLRRLGFTATLRAVGPLIPDQFAYAVACGFDEVELPEASAARQHSQQWLAALGERSNVYQRGYAGSQASILDRRRKARTTIAAPGHGHA
jgi:uncharacterized protein (DUF934 family)